jgi:uncharacterized protein YciI
LAYFLVLLHPVAGSTDPPDHEPFVDSLVARNLVLLGGDLVPSAGGAEAAYVLSCASLEDARKLVAEDPLVSSSSMRAEIVEWELVGVNPQAIEPSLHLVPDDVRP